MFWEFGASIKHGLSIERMLVVIMCRIIELSNLTGRYFKRSLI